MQTFFQAVSVIICLIGLKLGKVVINSFTLAKIALVAFMVVAGLAAWTQSDFGIQACDLHIQRNTNRAWSSRLPATLHAFANLLHLNAAGLHQPR
jgi:hypothetical protein